VDPVPDPLLLSMVEPGIEPGTSGLAARNSGIWLSQFGTSPVRNTAFRVLGYVSVCSSAV
jgi:hypothetical protein